MIKSMTGYGRGEARLKESLTVVELKTVNNRGLECSFKLPTALWSREAEARALVGGVLARGKVDLIWREESPRQRQALSVDLELARSYARAAAEVARALGRRDKPGLEAVLRFPGVLQEGQAPAKEDPKALERRWQQWKKALQQALRSLDESRRREGLALQKELEKRLESSLQLTAAIEEASLGLIRGARERLAARVAELLEKIPADDPRLMMEAAVLAERSDIREELVRFRTHVGEFGRLLKAAEPAGKRMDFLCQELLREANTMGSKSPDAAVAHRVVELKAEIEKIREQVQNVE